MNRAPERYRTEWKFDVPPPTVSTVVHDVRMLAPPFVAQYAARTVYNLYFDTPAFGCHRLGVEGALERVKIRVRWYGTMEPETVQLELKRKSGERGWKEVFPLTHPFRLSELTTMHWSEFWARQTLSPTTYTLLRDVTPTLLNVYRRSYWYAPSTERRITIDTELGFAHPAAPQRLRMSRRRAAVVELKWPLGVTPDEDQAPRLRWRRIRHSKYTLGMQTIYGGLL